MDPRAVAVLAARRVASAELLGTAFEVSAAEFHSLSERERDYEWTQVSCQESHGVTTRASMCVEPADAADRPADLWRDDVLPCPPYLALCLDAARSLGNEVYEDFLGTTFLADGVKTLGAWLAYASG